MTPSTTGLNRLLRALLPPLFWLGVWQGAAWLVELWVEGRGNELLLPYPLTVLRALVRLAGEGTFWASAAASLGRVVLGMAAGTLLAALLAAAAAGGGPYGLAAGYFAEGTSLVPRRYYLTD